MRASRSWPSGPGAGLCVACGPALSQPVERIRDALEMAVEESTQPTGASEAASRDAVRVARDRARVRPSLQAMSGVDARDDGSTRLP